MKKLSAFLGMLLLASCAQLAQAAFQISYSLNGGGATIPAGCVTTGDTGESCFALPTSIGGGVTIQQLTGTSNSPGTSSLARQTGSTVEIDTTSAATLTIWLAAPNFTAPNTPPDLDYFSSLTIIPTTGTGSATLESCIDTSNGLAPPTGPFCSANAATLSNAVTYSGITSLASNATTTVSSLTGGFSLSQVIMLSLGANSIISLQTRQSLTPVPEPMSISLLGGVVLLTVRAIRRKMSQGVSRI